MRKIILASASPRRRELLKILGLPFRVEVSGYREVVPRGLKPAAVVKHLSLGKAMAVASRHRDAIIIAADTIVVCQGKIMGKPRSRAVARAMLVRLSGRSHQVVTGVTMVDCLTRQILTRAVTARVTFHRLSARTIATYVRFGAPMDKAGGYAPQGMGIGLVASIAGDYSSVSGLPLALVVRELRRFGVAV